MTTPATPSPFSALSRRRFLGAGGAALALGACQQGSGAGESDAGTPIRDGIVFRITEAATSRTVSPRMAGVNYLMHRDLLDGTYGERADALGTRLFRWPGGAVSEWNTAYHTAYLEGQGAADAPWALERMLAHAAARDAEVMVTLPTKKYLDPATGQVDRTAIDREIGPFVQAISEERFGGAVPFVQIGNEFFWSDQDHDPMEAEPYIAIARAQIAAIGARVARPPGIIVQGGRFDGNDEIGRVAAGFDRAERALITHVSDHLYPSRYADARYESRLAAHARAWDGIPLAVTEWNVKARTGVDPMAYSYGIAQAAALMRMWDGMVAAGVDLATFWAVQQNNWTSAYQNEGVTDDAGPFVAGRVLPWLTGTVGAARMDALQLGADGMDAWAYRSADDRLIVFVAGLEAGRDVPARVELPGSGWRVLAAERMSGPRTDWNPVPVLEPIFPALDAAGAAATLTLNRQTGNEVARIVFTRRA